MWGAEAPTSDPVTHGPALAGGQREPPSHLPLGWGPGHPRALISQQASSLPRPVPTGQATALPPPPLGRMAWPAREAGVTTAGVQDRRRHGRGPVHNPAQPWKGAAGTLGPGNSASPAPLPLLGHAQNKGQLPVPCGSRCWPRSPPFAPPSAHCPGTAPQGGQVPLGPPQPHLALPPGMCSAPRATGQNLTQPITAHHKGPGHVCLNSRSL